MIQRSEAKVKMKTIARRRLTCSALLIGALVGAVTHLASAQSVHRAKIQIVAGPTVQVSKAASDVPHWENLAAGDAVHSGRLITCSMATSNQPGKLWSQNCYVSF